MYKHFFKRLLDIMISGLALLCLSPILLILTIWLHYANKGAGAFFTQERPGKNARIFKVIKFKSMTNERDASGRLLPDKDRITPVGRFIRKTSLDELPQFVNVLKGDMSLIGPRPLLPEYLPWYTKEEMKRHDVRPGISGLAQAHSRTQTTWEETFADDIYYVDHLSFSLDVKIILKTLIHIIQGSKDIDVVPKGGTTGRLDLARSSQQKTVI
jgi:lipopolysaccharide/colanic/teichoic acid biosynthesis glycosyltransferase